MILRWCDVSDLVEAYTFSCTWSNYSNVEWRYFLVTQYQFSPDLYEQLCKICSVLNFFAFVDVHAQLTCDTQLAHFLSPCLRCGISMPIEEGAFCLCSICHCIKWKLCWNMISWGEGICAAIISAFFGMVGRKWIEKLSKTGKREGRLEEICWDS